MSFPGVEPGRGDPVRLRAYEPIVERIEHAIRAGDLVPGDRLPSERELVARYGVSRSTVREALGVLENRRLITRSDAKRRGAVVRPYSPEPAQRTISLVTQDVKLSDLVQFRMVADAAASLAAGHRRTPEQLVRLERNMARMRESLDLGYAAFSRIDVEFHQIIAEIAGNDVLRASGDTVRESCLDLIQQSILVSESGTPLMLQTIGHHREVFRAIAEGDGIRASRLTRESLYTYYSRHVNDDERTIIADLVIEVGGSLRD